ncbi:SET domain-containing protein [Algoriphagus confluentis]|uniref:SET domain-containing protein-lysine N-methyltransferase n=1 Tax=Algoriphagus confluentis TaxID=1697556 RepID=A0ABQ6PRV1_9BACT|nr:SET domain-containing protein-lysine N-methyltransferase [Algoriphagus confluentis]
MDSLVIKPPFQKITESSRLYVADAGPKGRGVFAGRAFKKGEIVESCPIIPWEQEELYRLSGHLLERYVFLWDKRNKSLAVVLGFGSLYNHSSQPNCGYSRQIKNRLIVFKAKRAIGPHEELTIHYGPSAASFHEIP